MARRPPGGTRAQREGVKQRRKAGVLIELDIGGSKEVLNNLKKLKLSVGRRVVNRAIAQATARIMQPAIDANIATVSPGQYGTGLLKDRPSETRKISKKATHLGYGVFTATRNQLNIQGDDTYYPAILEVGNSKAGIEGQHMLKRARDQKASRVKTFLRRTIRAFMEEEIAFIAGKNANRVAAGKKPLSAFRSARQIASFQKRGLFK